MGSDKEGVDCQISRISPGSQRSHTSHPHSVSFYMQIGVNSLDFSVSGKHPGISSAGSRISIQASSVSALIIPGRTCRNEVTWLFS
ncbi:hypothetical protein I79_021871 [Cricetulus griseus]|uniref:Uncharacterized protein n=1 Tax=Cricetulus griseus TaxID=10029 RepID=G3IDT5_CRIGR|nr:hypothetical protein I79_021871 [Cricetulus griseus]